MSPFGTAARARARVAQGGAKPSRGRPPRAAPRGRSGGPTRARRGPPSLMPRETLTSSPRPVPAPAGGGRCRAVAQDRLDLAALGADPRAPGTRGRARRRGSRTARPGAVAPTTSPTVPPGPHVATRRATRRWSGSGGRVDRRVGGDDEVLELGRLGVRGPAQDVGVPVEALEERRDRLAARVRVDGHRIRARGGRTGRPRGAPRSSRCRRAWRR